MLLASKISTNNIRVGVKADGGFFLPLISKLRKHIADALYPRLAFVITLNNKPRAVRSMRAAQHTVFVFAILPPKLLRPLIYRANFPLLERVLPALLEAFFLLLLANIKPKLDKQNAIFIEHVLRFRHLTHKLLVLLLAAKAIHRLYHCPIVPASIKENYLPRVG